jgi:hypothetical protein
VQAVAGVQGAHAPALAFANVPTGQLVALKAQEEAPRGLKDPPAAQGRQAEEEFAPRAAEKVPAAQGLQALLSAAPGVALKVPGAQGVHAEEEAAPGTLLKVPGGQGRGMGVRGGQKAPLFWVRTGRLAA